MNDLISVLTLCLGFLGDIIIGVVVFVVTRKLSKAQQRREEAEKNTHASKTRLELLHLQLVDAGNSLSYAVAMAVKRGSPNGEVEEGISKYKKAKKAYFDYLTEIGLSHFIQEEDI